MSTDETGKRGGGFRRENERPGGQRGGYPRSGGAPFRRDNERPREGGFRREGEREGGQQGWRPFQSPRSHQGGFGGRDQRGDQPFAGRDDRGDRRPQSGENWRDRERPTFNRRDQEGDRRERPSFENRENRDRRPFEPRERPSFERRERDDDRGDRPSFGNRDRRPPFENQERPSFRTPRDGGFHALEDERGERPSFNSRWREGDRPSFGGGRRENERPSFGGPRPGGDRPSFGNRSGYQGNRSYEQRPDRPPFEGQGRPLGTSTRMGRPPVNQFEPVKADVYGRWPVLESLRAGNVTKIYLAAGVHDSADHLREIQTMAAEKHVPVIRVERFALDRVLGNANHQGIAAACRPYQYVDLDNVLEQAKQAESQPLVLLFDGIQDPQNLGSILRTAEAVGVGGAILPRHNQVGVTPSVVRASAGAAEHLPIAEVTNLRQTVARLKDAGYWIVGLDMEGGTDYDNFEVDNPIALVIGGEGKGLSRLVTEECDYLVRLPMRGKIGSLNASVAAGIVLYEIDRRRGGSSTAPAQRRVRPPADEPVAEAALSVEDASEDEDEDLAPYAEADGAELEDNEVEDAEGEDEDESAEVEELEGAEEPEEEEHSSN